MIQKGLGALLNKELSGSVVYYSSVTSKSVKSIIEEAILLLLLFSHYMLSDLIRRYRVIPQ